MNFSSIRKPLPSLMACCRHGYWFCGGCQKVVSIGVNNHKPCPRCRTYKIRWQPAAF